MSEQVPTQQTPENPTVQANNDNPTTPPAGDVTDASKLSAEQVDQILSDPKILENPNFWKHDRLAELRDSKKKLSEYEKAQQTAAEKQLEEQKKFEELATTRQSKIDQLEKENRDLKVNTQLSTKLAGLGVVDMEAALALIDRTKIEVDADGVKGLDDAVNALKESKTYLFKAGTPTEIGNPTNPVNGNPVPTGAMKFKRSQLTPEFMEKNRDAVYEAMNKGLIENDMPPVS